MDERFDDPVFLQRTLNEYARDYLGIAHALWDRAGTAQPDVAALGQSLVAGYQRLFAPPSPAAASTGSGAAQLRYQRAAARSAELAASIASEAARRFSLALAATGPEAPPITSLRELHTLWIECGESAYGEAAHGEEFAAVQAELIMALVELGAAAP